MRTLPLLPPARPVHLAVHPTKAVLVVACQGSDKLWEMRCIHPVSGALLSAIVSCTISSTLTVAAAALTTPPLAPPK